ncbi:LysM domain-containing protein [Besnoitia besnoiti]|uniref:LysM domain-containing protein n=1 Tax=Besnoitia besnoiti TaxID=94643 RepID=A0A2A9M6J0_BESBE|nr:LysM domain-containing protein [Besnoitia besnoiti]PFH33569.1 LysM domain-containing protein [Besnoitia besnoiti]
MALRRVSLAGRSPVDPLAREPVGGSWLPPSLPSAAAGGEEGETAPREACRGNHVHAIQPADTLLSIALQYDVPVPRIMLANRLSSADIWFKNELLIPCSGRCAQVAAVERPAEARRDAAEGAGDRARRLGPAAESAVDAASAQMDAACVRTEIPDLVHRTAHTAMLVEALVRQEGVDVTLARAQLAFRNGNADVARADCRLVRRWQDELDVTTPEILAYLSVNDGDVVKARNAMLKDEQWLQEQEEAHRTRARARPASFSVSSLLNTRSLFSSASARYVRLADETGLLSPLSRERSGGEACVPRVIGKASSAASSASTDVSPGRDSRDDAPCLFSVTSSRASVCAPRGTLPQLRQRLASGQTRKGRRETIDVEMRQL